MTERISLVEAYDNRDVIAQLVRLRDNVDELLNILKDIDPNGDLTNVVTKTGDQTIDGVKTFIGQIVADCDIIQNGAAYETHAEQVFSVNDYIVTRDGQITGLASGDLSGFHVKKYNGVDDSRLGVDNTGTMRVGDVGSEQPLMTRDETGDMTSGNFVLWDGVNEKAITSSLGPSGVIKGSGNIGSDTTPVKIVNGEPVAVTNALQTAIATENVTGYSLDPVNLTWSATYSGVSRYGKVIEVAIGGGTIQAGSNLTAITGLPKSKRNIYAPIYAHGLGMVGFFQMAAGSSTLTYSANTATSLVTMTFIYLEE